MRTSKLCNIVEVSLGKQQVTPEVQYPSQAGHLLQTLQISYHSMKMRCEWLNMALLHFNVDIYLIFTSQVTSISFSFAVLLQVKFKIALCHSALCEHREALHEVTVLRLVISNLHFPLYYPVLRIRMMWYICFIQMEGIPSKVRTLKMNMMLGKLYRISRNSRTAVVCYKECLRYDISKKLLPWRSCSPTSSTWVTHFILL